VSRVYFNSPSATAELHGSERAWCGGLVQNIATGVLRVRWNHEHLATFITPGHYLHHIEMGPAWMSNLEMAFAAGGLSGEVLQYEDRPIESFSLILNTAVLLGNEQVRLAARIHAQCELHAWVDGPNRAWLAGVILRGLEAGLYRPGGGWEEVAELLGARDDEPVVMSYSVGDSFPNSSVRDWSPPVTLREDDEPDGAWYDLSAEEQWAISMEGLRARKGHLEIVPENPQPWRYGHGLSVLDITAPDWELRVRAALGMEGDA